jgi:putative membrane protein
MPSFELHPEVLLLVGAVVAMGLWAVRVIGPKVVPAGEPVVTPGQRRWFVAGVAVLFIASMWPVHDISEQRLYSVHMVQHTLLAFVVPPMFLLATPSWLARLIVGEGTWLRPFCHPVVAGGLFNAVALFLHWQWTVNTSVENGAVHYGLHVLVVAVALLMWVPVCGPLPELRLSLPGQMIYLFLMSIIPTVPAAWLTMAEGAVYEAYDHDPRLWGVSVTDDQQLAGLFMKLVTGFYLWGLIIVLFFRWAGQEMGPRRTHAGMRRDTERGTEPEVLV